MFYEFMDLKRKKMNFQMMILADCINLEGSLPQELLDYIRHLSEIFEVRAVGYKDLKAANKKNNLYSYWHLFKTGVEDQ